MMHVRPTLTLIVTVMLLTGCSQAASPTSPSLIAAPGGALASNAADTSGASAETTIPIKGRLEGIYAGSGAPPIVTVHVEALGNATHLGRFTFDSVHQVNFIDFTGAGTAVLTAANGDQLMTDQSGVAAPGDAPGVFHIVETLTITGGTGRFAGATGQFVIERESLPEGPANGTTTGSLEGTLSLPHGAH